MSAHFPDTATVRSALELASRAPSVHNSQPWQWRVGPHSLHLYADPARHLPHTDPDQRDLLVSCGAALNHTVVALAALGWQAKVHRLPDPAAPLHVASIELYRHPPTETDITLAAAIPRRRTDRRHLSSLPVSLGDIALMGARVARSGVTLRRIEVDSPLQELLAEAVRQHTGDAGYLGELTTWSGRHASTTGVPARSTPVSDSAARVPGRVFTGAVLTQPPAATAEEDTGVLLALATAADDEIARVRAGEATSLLLLTATVAGLATCPVTEILEVTETRELLRHQVFIDGQFPQMLVRVGWSPLNSDPLPATPRLPLAEVVRALDGSSWVGV